MGKTQFIWDPLSDNVLQEKDEFGTTQVTYSNEPDQFGNLISQRRGGETSYYHFDGLGSTRELTDSSENVTDTNIYDAWGVDVASSGSTVNPYKWVGEYGYAFDHSLTQYYVRARSFEPPLARWLSVDPLGELFEGASSYVYGSNLPTFLIDPAGLAPTHVSGPWIDVISWLEKCAGGNSLINAVANPAPPDSFKPCQGATTTVGAFTVKREFRNHHSMHVRLCCEDGVPVETKTTQSIVQNVGYTPLRILPGGWKFEKGEKGVSKVTESINGACYTVTSKVRFRVNWKENVGQATINWKLFPWAWSQIEYTICCDGNVFVGIGGSYIPSQTMYVNGCKDVGYSMCNTPGGVAKASKKFIGTGGGKDAPGTQVFAPENLVAPEDAENEGNCGCQ